MRLFEIQREQKGSAKTYDDTALILLLAGLLLEIYLTAMAPPILVPVRGR
jgi:hypothetical protein